MGTNYYYYPGNSVLDASIRILEECLIMDVSLAVKLLREAKESGRIHIGKSSGGWCFALHVTDTIRSLEDWKAKWDEGGVIRDEYGEEKSPDEMLRIITFRSWPEWAPGGSRHYESPMERLEKNDAELGPNNLLRAKIGPHCCGHGDGTWDLIEGEFS
jgi:hypothetical protein